MLAEASGLKVEGEAEIRDIVAHSGQATPGSLFVCYPGLRRDPHEFLADAAQRGAVAAMVHHAEGRDRARRLGMATLLAPSECAPFARAVGMVCQVGFGDPTASMQLYGVTGTNGKTTTAWVVRQTLEALGHSAAYLGTLGLVTRGGHRELDNTTPFGVDLFRYVREAREEGAEALVMEVSSHALAEERVAGLRFNVGVFTNLTQDHLDYHGTMEAYASAKRRLFTEVAAAGGKSFTSVLNIDDPYGAQWASELGGLVLRTGHFAEADLRFEVSEVRVDRIRGEWLEDGRRVPVEVGLGGSFNVENVLSAAGALRAGGYVLEAIADAMRSVRPAPGRFESVETGRDFAVLVDYAHTPDALAKLLTAVRELSPRRIITVFGCGGDRDRTKRPLMARAASEASDLTIATSDNPRTEDPSAIIKDIEQGFVPDRMTTSIVDRVEAVTYAVRQAGPGDVVVVAGKGHENYQVIGLEKIPMDDRDLVRRALEPGP